MLLDQLKTEHHRRGMLLLPLPLNQYTRIDNADIHTDPMICETTMRYRADISAGALKVPETRVIAGLLLRGVDEQEWKQALISDNILQTRNSATAIRLARLIKARLALMDADLWKMIYEGTGVVAVHAALAAAIKHSLLLGDFLDLVVREQYHLFNPTLSNRLWDDYLSDCRGRDPEMPEWNESTRRRLRSSVFQALAQAGFIVTGYTQSTNFATINAFQPTYGGGNYGDAFVTKFSAGVQHRETTATTLSPSVNPAIVNQIVVLTATVTGQYGGQTPTGQVEFMKGNTLLGTVSLSGGQASLNKSFDVPGTKFLTAVYLGDSNFAPSVSSILGEAVLSAYPSTTTLGSSLNPSIVGQQVTFTATVSSDFGSPTGTVTFYKGEKALGTATLNSNGVGQLTTSTLPVGTHPMSAVYSGDTNFEGSTSPPLDQTINQASTTTTLTSSPNPSAVDQQVTFTAIVTPLYGGTPTGTVTFTQNGDNIGTAPVINGQAIFSKSFGSEGMKSMGANYSGDTNFTGSSGGMTQTVN